MQHDEKNTSQHVEIRHVSRGVSRSFILRSFLRVAFLVSKGKAPMFTPDKKLFQKYQWLTSALYLKSMALMIWNNYFNHFRFELTIAHIGKIKTWYWEYFRFPYSTTTIISASMIPKSYYMSSTGYPLHFHDPKLCQVHWCLRFLLLVTSAVLRQGDKKACWCLNHNWKCATIHSWLHMDGWLCSNKCPYN